MELNEEEEKLLQAEMLFYGCQTFDTDYFESDDFKKLKAAIGRNFSIEENQEPKFKFCPKSEILKAGKYVINKHFSKFDLRVLHINDDLETRLYTIFGDKPSPEQYDDIIEYVKSNVERISVTDIPLDLEPNNNQNGCAEFTWLYDPNVVEKQFYKNFPPCIKNIHILGDCNENSKLIYVHEMCHALLSGNNKRNIRNLLNNEALSIFMEKVAALDLDNTERLLNSKNLVRLQALQGHFCSKWLLEFLKRDPLELLTDKKYIISSLHATALFDTYKKGNNRTRNAIDNAIGEVIMGHQTIEDVFEYYEATLEKGSKIIQKQIRKFS